MGRKRLATPKKKLKSFKKEEVIGLPPGALLQFTDSGTVRVFFPYRFRRGNHEIQERDYLGGVDPVTKVFEPNAYYLKHKPVRERRPLENWRDLDERKKWEAIYKAEDEAKLAAEQQKPDGEPQAQQAKEQEHPEAALDFPEDEEVQRSCGGTAILMAIAEDIGLVDDIAQTLNWDLKQTMHTMNLVLHIALTSNATYLAGAESRTVKFIGMGCLNSQRSSELLSRIGQDGTLSVKISKLRVRRWVHIGDLVATDGTYINSNSKNIASTAFGKHKDNTFGEQISFSLCHNITSGMPVTYRFFSGNLNDIQTIDDLTATWTTYGINEKNVEIVMDRGHYDMKRLKAMDAAGFRFIVGSKTGLNCFQQMIAENAATIFQPFNQIKRHRCFGVKKPIKVAEDRSFTGYVFLDPNQKMREYEAFQADLEEFATLANEGKAMPDDPRFKFFFKQQEGYPLSWDANAINEACIAQGCFALMSNTNQSPEMAMDKYSLRNEVEVMFRLMLGDLIKTTRVHSTAALDGLLFIVFCALSLIARLRILLQKKVRPSKKKKQDDATDGREELHALNEYYTLREVLTELKAISIIRLKGEKPRLINMTKNDKKLVADLGFEGLFANPEEVWDLLSAKRLAERIAHRKASVEPV